MRDGKSLPRRHHAGLCYLVWLALANDQLFVAHYPSYISVAVSWRRHRKICRHLCLSIPISKNQVGIEGSDTITSNGSEAMPLATTKSDDAPPSIPIGIATFVVTTTVPVATPIAGTVLPFTTVVWPDVRQYFT